MPLVSVLYSAEERAAKNADGAARGLAACPVCKDSILIKPLHEVIYEDGIIEIRAGQKADPVLVKGHRGQGVTCEECWQKLSINERVEVFVRASEARFSGIKSVFRVKINGQEKNSQEDEKRYVDEYAAIEKEKNMVIDAIKAGK